MVCVGQICQHPFTQTTLDESVLSVNFADYIRETDTGWRWWSLHP